MKGFCPKWCNWIESIVKGGNVGVKINDDIGHFFQTKKGLRQGDPLSPLLFNIVADMLATLISRAKENGQIRGLVPHLVEDGLSILQYADDTILFLEDDLNQAKNLKIVLNTFEKLSGLKINFHKSELYCFGNAKSRTVSYGEIFGCKEGTLPFRYLGIPMNTHKIRNQDWQLVETRFQKKLASWKSKLLSAGGRLVLINAVLSSLPMFMMSFFRIPKGVLKKLDYYRSRFYWQSDEHKKKYRLIKWGVLQQPKCLGGLGILDLETQNKCLLAKWIINLLNEDGTWQQLIKAKYLNRKTFTQVAKRPGDSQFWMGLMEIKDTILAKGRFQVNNGRQARFWEDVWVGGQALKDTYPTLYNITRRKNVSVASVISEVPVNMSFRRALTGSNRQKWFQLVESIAHLMLNEREDKFIWSLSKTGTYSVQSLYKRIMSEGRSPHKTIIWKLKIPNKIKIFLWYLHKGVTLTKDNLSKRKWKGSTKCCFCNSKETIQHLFFDCRLARSIWGAIHMAFGIAAPSGVEHLLGDWLANWNVKHKRQILVGVTALCWSIWLCRNDVEFNRKNFNSLLQVVFRGTYWTRTWAALSRREEEKTTSRTHAENWRRW
jgi:hypothetical protein